MKIQFEKARKSAPRLFREIDIEKQINLFAHPEKMDVDKGEKINDKGPLPKLQSDDVAAKSGKFDSVPTESAQPHVFMPIPQIASR